MSGDSEMWLGKSRNCGWASTKKGEIGRRLPGTLATGPLSRANEYLKYLHRRELGRSVFVPVQQSCNRLSLEEKRRSRATMELTSWQLEMTGKKERGVWRAPGKTFELQVGNLQELDIILEPPKTSLLIAKVSGLLGFPGLRQQRADGRYFGHLELSIRKSR